MRRRRCPVLLNLLSKFLDTLGNGLGRCSSRARKNLVAFLLLVSAPDSMVDCAKTNDRSTTTITRSDGEGPDACSFITREKYCYFTEIVWWLSFKFKRTGRSVTFPQERVPQDRAPRRTFPQEHVQFATRPRQLSCAGTENRAGTRPAIKHPFETQWICNRKLKTETVKSEKKIHGIQKGSNSKLKNS